MNTYPGQEGMRSPLKVARGNGSSHSAVHHWWLQRVTAIALIPLTIWFLFFAAGLVNATHAEAVAAIGEPVHTFLLIILAVSVYWHGMLGLDVIIGDYVHTRGREVALQIALRFGAILGAAIAILAVISTWLPPSD